MQKQKFIYNCDFCGSEFQFCPHIYNGKRIENYQLTVCKGCWDGNWDSWGPMVEQQLIAHLKERGIPIPKRNEKGWLPRE